MSWKAYVTNLLAGGHLTQAAILGLSDGAVWASSDNFPDISGNTPTGVKQSLYLVNNIFDFAHKVAQQNGIWVGSKKYFCVKYEGRSVYGRVPKGGVAVVRTKTCAIVALYDDTTTAGAAVTAVESLADYLITNSC
eukprot:TRINITY_DN4564_c0_g1_i2.p1 TRINITY_DN4564_c0_g1~~TRINITY_DN4564_c0_g1_i2.p1  ORF type:complete len:151 (-),score=52.18 TRINITY_DN4564_c0_g1_i2:97-504(-)